MTQNVVLKAVIERLRQAQIPHMVTGSVASSYYGEPRSTLDADVIIDPTVPALLEFVQSFGEDFYVSEEAARRALVHRRMFNVIHAHTGFKVDLIIRKDDTYSRCAFERRRPAAAEDVAVDMASPEDLILSKLQWARRAQSERQCRDARGVLEAQRDALDFGYLGKWAAELSVQDLLGRLLHEIAEERR